MRTFVCVIPLAVLAGCASMPSRSPPPEHYFDCDVPPGKYSEWNRTVSAGVVRISGTLELIEPRHDSRWAPVANVFIGGTDSVPGVGLRAYLDWSSPEVLDFILVGQGATPSRQTLLTVTWKGQTTPVTVELSGAGALKVSAANATETVQLSNFAIRNIQLGCSTAEFKFQNVTIAEQE